jgi:hypothetical protein
MADETLEERVGRMPDPGEQRVASRAKALTAEEQDSDDPESQAEAILAESDARVQDPAVHDPADDRVERRDSDAATPPADV